MSADELPAITTDTQQAKVQLQSFGLALLDPQLAPEDLQQARQATYAGAEEDRRLGREADAFGLDYGKGNTRVWNILNRDPVFAQLVQHPAVLRVLSELIGWPALLGNISANIAEPGNDGGAWHADQLFVPKPWPPNPQGMNAAWLLDDFTKDNGATEVIPKSHLWKDEADPRTLDSQAVPIVAPAGTLLLLDSRVVHRTGQNQSTRPRAGLFGWYTTPIYRTQENWFLSLDNAVTDDASDELLTLLGYKSRGLGLVYGRSPR